MIRSQDTDEVFTVTEQVVIFNNHIEKVYPGQTIEETINFAWGKPRRGESFQVATMTETRVATLVFASGSDRVTSKGFKRVSQNIEVNYTLIWTGKKFKNA